MENDKTFQSIYLKYYPTLVVYGRTISNDEQQIEDTIQELFITLWQKQGSQFYHSSFENYLFVAFRNNLIRAIKSKKTEIIPIEEEAKPALFLEREKELKSLLSKLPPSQREVIFLRYYQNKSYQEIAEILNIQYQVARNFSHRAIKFLRKHMKKLYAFL